MNISLKKIHVRVAERDLFRVPSWNVPRGSKILITGASGGGKTTFLHLLAGLFLPSEGSVHIGDTEISALGEDARAQFRRAHMGLVFQKLNLIDYLTPLENIALARHAGDARAALKEVGLAGREDSRTATMSLGEQQRVAIARALVSDAQIILADEPTSSLDERNALEVTQLLLRAAGDRSLIVVSHDQRIEKFFSQHVNFTEWTR